MKAQTTPNTIRTFVNVQSKLITFVPAGMTGSRLKALKINNLLNS